MSRDSQGLLTDEPIARLQDDRFEFKAAVTGLCKHLVESWPAKCGVTRGCTVLSIEGAWGWGKTSFSQMLSQSLLDAVDRDVEQPESGRRPVVVEYNAWLSGPHDGRHWTALAMRIGEAIVQRAQSRYLEKLRDHDAVLYRRVLSMDPDKKDRRLRCLRRKLASAVPLAVGHPDLDSKEPRLDLKLPPRAQVFDPRTPWTDWAWQLSQAVPAEQWRPFFGLFNDSPSKLPGRGLSHQQALDVLVDMGARSTEAALKGSQVAALGAPVAATRQLVAAYRGDGVPAEPESQEFVRALDDLCRVLHHEARGWRLVVRIEDVSRLGNEGRDALLEALAYLRQLKGCLVLLEIDRREADRVLVEARAGPHGEGRLTKTIDLRTEVPESRWHERVELIATWLRANLGFQPEEPADASLAAVVRASAHGLARWCQQHEVASPRELKRLLRWIDAHAPRLHRLPIRAPGILLTLAELYRHSALGVAGDTILAALQAQEDLPEQLVELPAQPWDQRPWPDQTTTLLPVATGWWEQQPADVRALVGAIRGFVLVLHLCGPDSQVSTTAEKQCWERLAGHLQALRGRNPLAASILRLRVEDRPGLMFQGLLDGIGANLSKDRVSELRDTGSLVELMGHLDLRLAPPSESFSAIIERWYDGAGLVEASSRRPADEVLDCTLLLLGLFHGDKYLEARHCAAEPNDDQARWRRQVTDALAQAHQQDTHHP